MLKKQIYDYLQTQSLMNVSTFGDEPWPAIVFFIPDKELNLYFTSSPKSVHSENIKKNPDVAVSIFDSSQVLSDEKAGIQLNGQVEIVNSIEQIKWTIKFWNKLITQDDNNHEDYKDYLKGASSRVYKVVPKKIQFFNQELFEEPPFKVLEMK